MTEFVSRSESCGFAFFWLFLLIRFPLQGASWLACHKNKSIDGDFDEQSAAGCFVEINGKFLKKSIPFCVSSLFQSKKGFYAWNIMGDVVARKSFARREWSICKKWSQRFWRTTGLIISKKQKTPFEFMNSSVEEVSRERNLPKVLLVNDFAQLGNCLLTSWFERTKRVVWTMSSLIIKTNVSKWQLFPIYTQ